MVRVMCNDAGVICVVIPRYESYRAHPKDQKITLNISLSVSVPYCLLREYPHLSNILSEESKGLE